MVLNRDQLQAEMCGMKPYSWKRGPVARWFFWLDLLHYIQICSQKLRAKVLSRHVFFFIN